MTPKVQSSIHRASLLAAGLGAVLSPIPFADEIALMPLYAGLTWRIGRSYGLSLRAIPWRPVAAMAAGGLAARAGLNLWTAFLPGVAAVVNAATAAAFTQVFGRMVDRSMEQAQPTSPEDRSDLRADAAAPA